MSLQATKPVEVFLSYSHLDEEMRIQLEKHLSLLEWEGLIKIWHDRRIKPGDEWNGDIDENLNLAQIILLLISPNFMFSRYCREVEAKRAMERHEAQEARVIPIILDFIEWQGKVLGLGKLQALPKDAKAINAWANRNEAFLNIAQGIRQVVEELVANSSLPPSADTKQVPLPPGSQEGQEVVDASASEDKQEYLKKVKSLALTGYGEISDIGRRTLDALRDRLGLQPQEADAIEAEVLKPYQEYKVAFFSSIQQISTLTDDTRKQLKNVQQNLKLRDEDVALIEARVCADLGDSLRQQGMQDAAIARYDEALKLKPDYSRAWYGRGLSLAHLHRHEDAINSYEQAIKFESDLAWAWYDRGNALGALEHYEEAITSYNKALKIKPDYSNAWFGRGLALKKLGRHVEELDSYVKAIEFEPDRPWYWYNRGNALGELRRYWEAIACYNQALRLQPDYPDAIKARHEAGKQMNG
jgi:tetratricopeptide (TPR) repeat protein